MTMHRSDAGSVLPSMRPVPVVVALAGLVLFWFFSRSAILGALSMLERVTGSVSASHFIWAGPSVVLHDLPASVATEPVTLVGYVPHEQVWTVECGVSVRMSIGIRAGHFRQALPSSQACLQAGIALSSNWSWAPGDSLGSRDARALSFQIYELRVGDTSVPLGEIARSARGVYGVENIDLRNDAEGTLTRMWDASWYKSIATTGYHFDGDSGRQQDVGWPFMYPMLVKLIAKVAAIPVAKSMLALNAALVLVTLVLLFVLSLRLGLSVPAAMIVPAWLVFNPFAYFLFAGFSEALFLALECAFVLLLILKRYFLAACVVALLGATRFIGYLFVVWLLFAIWTDGPSQVRWKWAGMLAAAAAGFLGVAADIGIKWHQTGVPLAAFVVRDAWKVTPFDQWSLMFDLTRLADGDHLPILLLCLAAFGYCVVVSLWCVGHPSRHPDVNKTWVAAFVVAATLVISPELNSVGRYMLPLAPALVGALATTGWHRAGVVLLPAITAMGAIYLPLVATRVGIGAAPW
jgi:hypothetical protein